MTLLLANWELVLVLIVLMSFAILKVVQFLRTPPKKRQELILLWLVQAVVLAEQKFGSGTGSVKLSYVYKLFIDKYGFLGSLVSQTVFEKLVDKALKTMEDTLREALEQKQNESK